MPPLAPPPWLINMQRFGPPPSYPGLKIPGLNAPIPHEAQWGFHPGGWGKPPVDEYGRPLYGDVFGTSYDPHYLHPYAVSMEKELWGELPPEVDDDMGEEGMDEDDEAGDEGDEDDMDLDMNEEEEENEEEDEDEDTKERNRNMKDTVMDGKGPSEGMLEIAELTVVNQGHFTAAQKKGFYDQSKQKERQVDEEEGDEEMEIEEFVAGLETPAIPTDIELRKTQTTKPTQPTLLEPSSAFPPPSLYTILPEKKVSVSGMMGSERIYDMRAAQQKPELPTSTTEPTSSTPSMSSSSTPSTLHGNKDDKKKKLEEKKKKEFKF
ncbi:hypothetical protein HMI56_002644 [Coelomomyces lativittatus]|nr:hypothetical protein HMI56_002644 [Coelomomyces lativittatus]